MSPTDDHADDSDLGIISRSTSVSIAMDSEEEGSETSGEISTSSSVLSTLSENIRIARENEARRRESALSPFQKEK